MPDRHRPQPPTPEDALDRWLDALNDPHRSPPPAPPGLEEVAATARRYRDALGIAPHARPGTRAFTERNGAMNHALPLATPHPDAWRVVRPAPRRIDRRGRLAQLSTILTTAMVVALLLALGGAMIAQQGGLPDGSDDPTRQPGVAASPEGTSAANGLSCASPGYRAVVEGDVNEDTLALLGETEPPLNVDGDEIHIPTANGEIVTLSSEWTSIGGPMWSHLDHGTIRNIDTGQEWRFALQTEGYFAGIYQEPYLIVPATGNATDWQIIDTVTGANRRVSEIRGGTFTSPTLISMINVDEDQYLQSVETSVWLFSEDTFRIPGAEHGHEALIDPNTLILPADLAEAHFLDEVVDGRFFGETAYSPATDRIAFVTGTGVARTIVLVNPETGDTIAVRDDAFTSDAMPLTFSEDGSTLLVDQPGSIFAVTLADQPTVELVHQDSEAYQPIAHHSATMRVLVQYPDRHVAIIDAVSGEVTDFPDVTVPAPEYESTGPRRLSYDRTVHALFDSRASTVRYVNLETQIVSPETTVIDPEEDTISAAFQPEWGYVVSYPHADWSDGYAYLDEQGTLQVSSIASSDESWSIPAPDGFGLADDEVAQLFTNPADGCIVLHVATAQTYGSDMNGEPTATRSERVATWIAPLEPGAEWMQLNIQLTGWFHIHDEPAVETLPAMDVASPAATPAG